MTENPGILPVTQNPDLIAALVADACSDLARQIMAEGYQGEYFLAAFERLKGVVTRAVVGAVSAAASAPEPAPTRQAKPTMAASPPASVRKGKMRAGDPRQHIMLFSLDFEAARAQAAAGQVTPPAPVKKQAMTGAERSAKWRASRKTSRKTSHKRHAVTAQAVEIADKSESVTNVTKCDGKKRHTYGQAADNVNHFQSKSKRHSVTGGKKEFPPHPPKKKHNPLTPSDDLAFVPWESPLIPLLEELAGKPFGRFGSGRTVPRTQFATAVRLVRERSTAPPFKATG